MQSQERIDILEKRIDILYESLIVLIDTVKLLTCKIYGTTPDESPQEILDRADKMIDSWEE